VQLDGPGDHLPLYRYGRRQVIEVGKERARIGNVVKLRFVDGCTKRFPQRRTLIEESTEILYDRYMPGKGGRQDK
jgi:hypothetical protein